MRQRWYRCHSKMRNYNFVALFALTFLSSFSWRSQHHNNQPAEFGGSSSVTLLVGAIRANPNPIIDHDEYGNLLNVPIYIRGDEWLHWYEDGDGYTVIEDDGEVEEEEENVETMTIMRSSSAPPTTVNQTTTSSKRWYYATIDPHTDNLISTGISFGSPSYREKIQHMGLKKHTRPSGSSSAASSSSSNRRHDDMQDQSTGRRRRRRRMQSLSHESSSSSTLNNLVVLIRFLDHVNRTLPSPSDYNILMNGPGGTGTIAPTGSVQDVYNANSYGTFVLNSTVYPWITLSQTESYYAEGRSGVDSTRLFEGIREALNVIDADIGFDLPQFNVDYNDGDMYIDAMTIIHSGYGAEVGYSDCYGTVEGNRIWSHKYFLVTGDWTSNDGRVSVQDYNINAGLWGRCGSEIARIGLLAHETAHFLGLPDLYDPYGGEGVGAYCLMGNSWGFDGSQLYPPIMSPWSKIELGWLNPATLTVKGDYPLRRSWQYADVYRINLGTPPWFEYLLIENRQPGSFDALLPGRGGLAIWHIDESMYWESNTREGFPGQVGWPANGNHYHVALLQSDGRYDLERGINRGDSNDLFRYDQYFGVDHLSPSVKSDPILGPFPNTDTYRLNNVGRTNHYITDVSATKPIMTFSFLPSSPCKWNEFHFDLTLLTDGKGNEVSWSIMDTFTADIALSGSGYTDYSQVTVEQCLPSKCYTFVINDSGSDGLCCAFGTGGYSVRINGLKIASGSSFGSQDQYDLKCMGGFTSRPTARPTRKPTTSKPVVENLTSEPSATASLVPVESPSLPVPTLVPTVVCEMGKGLIEIMTDDDKNVNEINWDIHDLFGSTVLSSTTGHDSSAGTSFVRECVDMNSCYTFKIRSDHGSRYSVKYDDKIVKSSDQSIMDQSIMFGELCLTNGDTACSISSTAATTSPSLSMFRLELAVDNGSDIVWTLMNSSAQNDRLIRSAGPYTNCDVNTLALCLPRDKCYEFIISDSSLDDTDKGIFTVMFSHHDNDMVQNYTGVVNGMQHVVRLGTCYENEYSNP